MKKYTRGGNIYTEEEVIRLAEDAGLDIQSYINHFGYRLVGGTGIDLGITTEDVSTTLDSELITHPETNDDFLAASDSYFRQEKRVVEYLNEVYPEEKVRFVEAEFGRDTVEVLVGDEEPGEGKKFNLAFSQAENSAIFDEIKEYIGKEESSTKKPIYNIGDISNFESKSFTNHPHVQDLSVGIDKNEVVEDLRNLFPKQETGFTFKVGAYNTNKLVITAPNGLTLEGEDISEEEVKRFINENSISIEELSINDKNKKEVQTLVEKNILETSIKYINQSNEVHTQITFQEDKPFSTISSKYYPYFEDIKVEMWKQLGIVPGSNEYGLSLEDLDKVFTDAWQTTILAEENQANIFWSKEIVSKFTELGGKKGYTTWMEGLDNNFIKNHIKVGSDEAKIKKASETYITLANELESWSGDKNSQEYKNLEQKVEKAKITYSKLFKNYMAPNGGGSMMFDFRGNRINTVNYSEEEIERRTALDPTNPEYLRDASNEVELQITMLENQYLKTIQGEATNDQDALQIPYQLFLTQRDHINTVITNNNISLKFDLSNPLWIARNIYGGWADGEAGSEHSPEVDARIHNFVGWENAFRIGQTRGGYNYATPTISWRDGDELINLNNLVETHNGTSRQYRSAQSDKIADKLGKGGFMEEMQTTFLVPKDPNSIEFQSLVEKGVFVKKKDESDPSKDVYVLGNVSGFQADGLSLNRLGQMQMDKSDLLQMGAIVHYDFQDGEFIEGVSGRSDHQATKEMFLGDNWGGQWNLSVTSKKNKLGFTTDQDFSGQAHPAFEYLSSQLNASRLDIADLKIQAHAWVQLLHMNIDAGSLQRGDGAYRKGFHQGSPEAFEMFGFSARSHTMEGQAQEYSGDIPAQIEIGRDLFNHIDHVGKQLYPEDPKMAFKLSDEHEENLKMGLGEKFAYGMGSFTPMIAEFALISHGVGGVMKFGGLGLTATQGFKYGKGIFGSFTSLSTRLSNLGTTMYMADKAVKGGRYTVNAISKAKVAELARKAGMSIKTYLRTNKVGMTLAVSQGGKLQRASAFLINAGIEEAKMKMMDPLFNVDMGLGTGFGFYAGGSLARWATPFRFTQRGIGFGSSNLFKGRELAIWGKGVGQFSGGMNTLLEKNILAGIGGATGSQVATPLNALINDNWNKRTAFTTFLDEHYTGWGDWGGEVLLEVMQFGALGVTHYKRVDGNLTLKAKQDFQKNMIKRANSHLKYHKKSKRLVKDSEGRKPGEKGYQDTYAEPRVDKKKSNLNEFNKFMELAQTARAQIDVILNAQEYLDINVLENNTNRRYKRFIKQVKKRDNLDENPFELILTKDGNYKHNNTKGKLIGKTRARVILGEGKSPDTIVVDLRKMKPGTMPHEIYHVLMKKHFIKELGKSKEFQEQMQEKLNEAMRKTILEKYGVHIGVGIDGKPLMEWGPQFIADKNGVQPRYFSKEKGGGFDKAASDKAKYIETPREMTPIEAQVEKLYKKIQDRSTFNEEYVANLLEIMLNSEVGYSIFIENNMAGNIKRDLNGLREQLFGGTTFLGKNLSSLAPKLDFENPQNIIEHLARMGESWGRGRYNKRQVDRFVNMFKDMKVNSDGTLIHQIQKLEPVRSKNGKKSSEGLDVEIIVNTRDAIVKEQRELAQGMRQNLEDVRTGAITPEVYTKRNAPLALRWATIQAKIRAGKPVPSAKEIDTKEKQEMSNEVQAIYDSPTISKRDKIKKILATEGIQRFITRMVTTKFYDQKDFKEGAYKEVDFRKDIELIIMEGIYPVPGKKKEKLAAYDPVKYPNTSLSKYLMFRVKDKLKGKLDYNVGGIHGKTVSGSDKPELFEKGKIITENEFQELGDLEITSETTNTGSRLADVLTKESIGKDGLPIPERIVSNSLIKEIITNFKNLKNQPKQNAAMLDNLAPKKGSELLGKTAKHTSGKKEGKVDFKKTAENKIAGLVEVGPARAYLHGIRQAIMLRTGVKELEGISTLIDPLILDKFFKTSERILLGLGPGPKAQIKLKPPKGKTTTEITLKDGRIFERNEADIWVLNKLGARVIDGKLDLSKIKTQVRKPGDVNVNTLLEFEGEMNKVLTNQTVREHVLEFTDKKFEVSENIETMQGRVESLRTLTDKISIKEKEKLAKDLEKEYNKLEKLYEESGLSEEFISKDVVNTFIKSVKSAMSKGMASEGITLESINKIGKYFEDVVGPISIGHLHEIISRPDINLDKGNPLVQELGKRITRSSNIFKENIDLQIKELLREQPEVEIQVLEAKNYKDLIDNLDLSKLDASTRRLVEKYNGSEIATGDKSIYKKEGKKGEKSAIESRQDLQNKILIKLRKKGLDIDTNEKGNYEGFASLVKKTFGFGSRSYRIWVPGIKGIYKGKKVDGIWVNSTSADAKVFTDKIVKSTKKGKISAEVKEINDNYKIIDTGKFKTWQAEFVEINKGKKSLDFDLYHESRAYLSKDGTSKGYKKTLEANEGLRKIYLNTLRDIITEAKPGKEKAEAIIEVMRHLRSQTNIGMGIIKGTATITSVSNRLGLEKFEGNKGSMFHAEHQLQLLNHTRMFMDIVLNSKTNAEFKSKLDVLSKEFEQASTRYEDVEIYDSPLHGGKTGFIEYFKGRNLGTLSSIANIMYRPGIVFEMVDLKSEVPGETIGEGLQKKFIERDILDIIEFIKRKDPTAYTGELAKLRIDTENKKTNNTIAKNNAKLLNSLIGTKASEGVSNKDILKNLETIDKATKLGRKIGKKTKGMSTWDFDDTLAYTKSGVRYTLPNPSGKPQPKRKVIFMAGGAGSGKSNVINQLGLKKQGFKIVNQDISLEWLMKNHGMPTDMRDFTTEQRSTFSKLGWEARKIAARKQMKFQGKGDGVIVDGTGASSKTMNKLVKEFKDKGYDIQMIFVETSLETSQARNLIRPERSLRTGIVTKTWESVQGNKELYKEMFGERFAEVNTDNLKQGDNMPSDLIEKLDSFTKGYIKARLNAGEFADKGSSLKEQGAEFDFTEFNVVKEGKKGPFFQKFIDRIKKFGPEHQYILTARPPEAQVAIHEFLKAQGLDIPLENIKGLGNSSGEAKALWMLEKFSEGYNDMYFADDAIKNVDAVKHVLGEVDVRSKVVQAKSKNDVRDAGKLGSSDTYDNIKSSAGIKLDFEKTIAKSRPDLVKEGLVSKTVNEMIKFVDGLDVPANKKKKYKGITTKWLSTSNIKLPEDGFKIKEAIDIAEKYKEDIFSYRNPNELIEKYAGKLKEKPIKPNSVKEFRFSGEHKERGITSYDVENTPEGQQAVRDIINTHWGKDSNPWCVTEAKNGKLTEDGKLHWKSYSKGPKRILFQDGKLSSFYANRQYWDRMDNATDGPVIRIKDGRVTKTVELVEVGEIPGGKLIDEVVRETRTVSIDKKTVTTEIHENSQDGWDAGTKIVENRVKGITVKYTRYSPEGKVQEVKEFDKNGKAIVSYAYEPGGKISSVNTYGKPFGEMKKEDIVKEKGDMIEHEINDGKDAYFFGRIKLSESIARTQNWGETVVEIGWKVPVKMSDLKNFIKTVDGKVRLDLEKVIEIDPSVKGIPEKIVSEIKGRTRDLKPIKKVLNQLDIKSKTQIEGPQSKSSEGIETGFEKIIGEYNFRGLSETLNNALEHKKGVGAIKTYSAAKAKILGSKRRFKLFGSPGAEDFAGLVTYAFSGKGKQGEAHKKFFEDVLHKPFNRAYNEIHAIKQTISNDYKALRKQMPEIRKILNEKVDDTYTVDQAIRVHLWDKAGFDIPGLSKTSLKTLTDFVRNDADVLAFAEKLSSINKLKEVWTKPKDHWLGENITIDLNNTVDKIHRKEILSEFMENREAMFGKWKNGKLIGKNMNKIEAIYGSKHRAALENILWRMETGNNRTFGEDATTNKWINWINNATGTIMFFNQKSAALQTISSLNYMNGSFNNPVRAARAFANQPQYWKDFMTIMNSDMLVQRRSGLKINLEASEMVKRVGEGTHAHERALAFLLEKGFIPTKYADSFAIASGGATFYRNSIRKYKKQGLSEKQAEKRAWEDFSEMTEATQQSSRPDLISMQQASVLGRPILAFANTPMQMFRRHKRRIQDIANNRGNMAFNIGSALYYGVAQAMIFSYLSNAMFAVDDEEEMFTGELIKDENGVKPGDDGYIKTTKKSKFAETKKTRFVNTIADSYLRGIGTGGSTVAALKNGIMTFFNENKKKGNADYGNVVVDLINVSPPLGSKARKVYTALKSYHYDKEVMGEMGFDIDNPAILAIANVISASTNIPVDRVVMKINNIRDASIGDFETWERISMFMGFNKWTLGAEGSLADIKIKETEEKVKKDKSLIRKMKDYNVTTEEEVIRIDKGKEIKKLSKKQQQYILWHLDPLPENERSISKILSFKKEEERIDAILKYWDINNTATDSLLNVDMDKNIEFVKSSY